MESKGMPSLAALGGRRRSQSSSPLGREKSNRGIMFVIVFVVIVMMVGEVNGETMRWRHPGVSGRWLDPHNWIGSTSGLPRVPGPSDDVILSDYNMVYGSHYVVTLESRGDPVIVKTLTIGSLSCSPCGIYPQNYYFYDSNSASWKPIALTPNDLGYCKVALNIIAPTQLMVASTLSLTAGGNQLRLISDPTNVASRSSITAGTWDLRGLIYGVADLTGNVVLSGATYSIVRMYPNAVLPSSSIDQAGVVKVTGNFDSTAARLEFLVDYTNKVYSQLAVTGQVSVNSKNIIRVLGAVTNVTYPIITFGTTNTPDLTFDTYGGFGNPPSLFNACPALGAPILPRPDNIVLNGDASCSQTSSHDFSTLLAVTTPTSCCPQGYTNYPSCNVAICPGYPMCSGRGTCNAPNCRCNAGWEGFACEIPSCPGSSVQCEGNGECYAPLPLGSQKPYCQCRTGWGGADCATPLCPNNCTSPTHGTCYTQGNSPKCICKPGYQPGPKGDCSLRASTCPGQLQECSGHGTCSNSNCTCYAGWEGADCSLPACPSACNHHGVCVSDGATGTKCQCDSGWSGTTCSVASCNGGTGCSGHGYCSPDLDPPRCICDSPTTLPTTQPSTPLQPQDSGWSGPACATRYSPVCSQTNCVANGGTCGGNTTGFSCLVNTCPSGWKGWDCSEPVCENTGYPECNGHGNCQVVSGEPTCVCRPGYVLGADGSCQYATCEINGCSDHGTCRTDLATPTCQCDPYFYGPDCSLTVCPGYPEPCTGATFGQCLDNGTCLCIDPWQGPDCSIPVCPSTNGINCNDRGFCNSSSSPFFCECYEGFRGSACETAACPNDCSGHGVCDDTLSPPACRCDPFFLGDDCRSATSSSDSSTQETLNAVLYSLIAAGIGSLVLLGVGIIGGYFAYTYLRRRKIESRFRSTTRSVELSGVDPL